MQTKLIKSDTEHESALARISELFNAAVGTPEGDELELLVHLVEKYEEQVSPIDLPDPIEAIRFRMDQQGLKQADLVPYFGNKSKVSEILNGKRSLTLSMIRKLNSGLGIPADVLLQEPGQSLCSEHEDINWGALPLTEMLKRNWFSGFKGRAPDLLEQAEEVLGPFLFPNGYDCRTQPMAARKTKKIQKLSSDHALWAWQARVLQLSEQQAVGAYQAEAMTEDFMQSVIRLSRLSDGPLQARRLLVQNGISTIILHHLPSTHLDGAAMIRPDGRPVIALTLRYDRLDNFWFTLAHELGHVALHLAKGEKLVFLDDLTKDRSESKLEIEADEFAENILLRDGDLASLISSRPTTAQIQTIASKHNIDPSIVAGRVRHMRKDYTILPRCLGNRQLRKHFPDYKEGVA